MPLHPKWAAITAAMNRQETNVRRFMGELAIIDLNTPFGQSIARQLPEYFSEDEDSGGAIPLSVIHTITRRRAAAAQDLSERSHLFPQSHGATDELSIPLVEYAIPSGRLGWSVAREWNVALMPSELHSATKQGDKATLGGRELVLVEYNNNEGMDVAYFAPAERVDPTC